MLPYEVLLTFSFSALLLSLSPGPSNLFIMACTVSGGRVAGASAAIGMALGSFTYVILTALGLAALIVYSPTIFTGLTLAGAIYLVVSGGLAWRAAGELAVQSRPRSAPNRLWMRGLMVELTNPKTGLFFLAFLPQFTRPALGNVPEQLLVLGTLYAVIALGCDLVVVSASAKLGRWLQQHPRLAKKQEQGAAAVLIILGVVILINALPGMDLK
ncbi:LysE family translocator [Alteromonas sp. ASW11-19]|uniref:LysE family translocator n=1 Tax=Alteromonas salexigens TaxID=2982530 RepID=A0ABT2VK94_9ALTE|nr:LysE family translocator [Alteromonas salexigens]